MTDTEQAREHVAKAPCLYGKELGKLFMEAEVEAAVLAAILRERERCARIAGAWPIMSGDPFWLENRDKCIADAIRKEPT